MMKIAHATPQDVIEIQRLLRETWNDTYGGYFFQATLDEVYKNWQSIEFLTRQIEDFEIYFPIVKETESMIGVATARLSEDVIVLFRLYVYPQHQRKGIGELLINNVIRHFPKAKKIQLHVDLKNEKGQAFYKKQGFKEMKRESEKVANEVIDQILMVKEL
ncbi:GNAT family N-acetyltransferase [Candidatus Gottesmanbacteria bacterium]|nr:GNAT family N-acetyltransferase [Candidatus Gottesmanbacteria bacterium]